LADLNIVDFDEESVTLRWAKPHNDGGKPISNYIIQKKARLISSCLSFLALLTSNTILFKVYLYLLIMIIIIIISKSQLSFMFVFFLFVNLNSVCSKEMFCQDKKNAVLAHL
jgi:hypothetical protein